MLFTKEFLEKLQEISSQKSLLDFLISHQKKKFHDAIIEISEFCGLEVEYYKRNEVDKEMKWTSVKESFPHEKDHMVLCIDMNDKYKPMCLGKRVGDSWWIESQIEDMKTFTPTHWIRLPDAPVES